MKQAGPLVLMIVGALVLVASIAWPSVFPSSTYWSEVDEAELEEMQSRVHNLSYLAAQAEEGDASEGIDVRTDVDLGPVAEDLFRSDVQRSAEERTGLGIE